jgi:hypothetical protein
MKIALGTLGTIFGICATSLYHFNHSASGFCFAVFAVIFLASSAGMAIRDLRNKKTKPSPHKPMGVMTDDNDHLIIKTISDENNGFATLSDIVRDTGLRPRRINKTLDWLCANRFATIIKGRNGKAYVLTPEGRSKFPRIINGNINKVPTQQVTPTDAQKRG